MTDLTVTDTRALTAAEHQAFERCCQTVDDHLKDFIAVGEALATLKEGKLFRVKFPDYTFEQFVEERWHFSRQRAYQYINSSAMAIALSDTVTVPSERIARALMPLKDEPGAARLALTVAIATALEGRLTAEWVESTVAVVQDAMGTDGLVDNGKGNWAQMNAAITHEAHQRMIEKRSQMTAGKQKPIASVVICGEDVSAIVPKQVNVRMDRMYRVVVYEIVEVDGK